MNEFYQIGPSITNQYQSDNLLKQYLMFRLPLAMFNELEPDLSAFGDFVAKGCMNLENEAETNFPVHVPYSPWGERIDEIQVSPAWEELHAVSAREGLVAIGYERKQREFSRLYQFAKLYLFHPSSAFYSCPLAMTDGAAKLIEIYGDEKLKERAFRHLTSRDPDLFWTSGQWMTERTGGSDVGGTQTIAKPTEDGYRLYGTKWFSSATTAQMTIALARIEGDPQGSRGLSAFYIETRDAEHRLNGISINRLKDKLGTKALPTAEVKLEGTRAQIIGERCQGVATISALFNITRIYNSVCSLGGMRRALFLAKDYAKKRVAFGKPLSEHALHVETLAGLELEFTVCFHLTFHLAYLLGMDETTKISSEKKALLRFLTPLVKLYTGKKAVELTSEALECVGGAAYIEDTGFPRLLRNAQVFPIWEGTTNILSLDVLRAIEKDHAFPAYTQDVMGRLQKIQSPHLQTSIKKVSDALQSLVDYVSAMRDKSKEEVHAGAREFALAATRVFAAGLLLEFADWSHKNAIQNEATELALRWCARDFQLPRIHTAEEIKANRAIVFP